MSGEEDPAEKLFRLHPWRTEATPTHEMIVRVPLNLTHAHDFDMDPVKTSLKIVMAVSRVRLEQLVCGDPVVELRRLQ